MAGRKCVFCGDSPVTREHVWPVWLGKAFRRHVSDQSQTVTQGDRSWKAIGFDLTVKRVCKTTCNEGWMANLEDRTRPILEPMIVGSGSRVLDRSDQGILAEWAQKTILMANFLLKVPDIPQSWYAGCFKNHRPPDQCAIWLAPYGGHTLAGHLKNVGHEANLSGFERHDSGLLVPSNRSLHAFMITLTAWRVVFQVLGYTGETVQLAPTVRDQVAQQIWPPVGHPLVFPRDQRALDDDALEAFATRSFRFRMVEP